MDFFANMYELLFISSFRAEIMKTKKTIEERDDVTTEESVRLDIIDERLESETGDEEKVEAEKEGLRQRLLGVKESEEGERQENLQTSEFDNSNNGWVETDPETTQTFRRTQQVPLGRGYTQSFL